VKEGLEPLPGASFDSLELIRPIAVVHNHKLLSGELLDGGRALLFSTVPLEVDFDLVSFDLEETLSAQPA
jgi:hypothetical protein